MKAPFLEVRQLKVHFPVTRGILCARTVGMVKAVDGVSLVLPAGEVLGLVGESGCGKTTLGRTLVQLNRATSGEVLLEGQRLDLLEGAALRETRSRVQMIFQDPFASLNPRMTVFDTLAEAIQVRQKRPAEEVSIRVAALMRKVGLAPRYIRKYPHEFSGGQRQRIAIARALAVEPRLIVADEPVSALDVSIQAQIINLLAGLTREMGLTMVFISHDLSVVKHISHRIAVMYLGQVVELGPAEAVIERPLHPYTQALISAVPIPDPERAGERRRILLPGDPPSPLHPPPGCRFHPRCPAAVAACAEQAPVLTPLQDELHQAACLRLRELHTG